MKIEVKLLAWPADELKPVMNFLHHNLKKIITGRPDELETLELQILPLIAQAKVDYGNANKPLIVDGNIISAPAKITRHINLWCKQAIQNIFRYDTPQNDSFTQKHNGGLAYRHAKRLNTNTCPYCNANFTFTIKNKRTKTRPQFDHFLDKGTHPYFAVSFYNLIPSCQTCNSSGIKGKSKFSIKSHLHPFVDQMEGLYQFRTEVDAVDFLVNGKDFKLRLLPCNSTTAKERKRARKSIIAFSLDERYKFHKDCAEEIIKKAYVYNNAAVDDLFTSFNIGGTSIFKSEAEVKEFIMGNFMHPDMLHHRIFSKLTKDIAEEFGLTL